MHKQARTPDRPHDERLAYNSAPKQRGALQFWFDLETAWLVDPSGKRGHPTAFTGAAFQASPT